MIALKVAAKTAVVTAYAQVVADMFLDTAMVLAQDIQAAVVTAVRMVAAEYSRVAQYWAEIAATSSFNLSCV